MDPVVKDLISFLKSSRLRIESIVKVANQPAEYILHCKTAYTQHHSIVGFALDFKFDMDSFLIKYKEWYPDHAAVNESFALDGIKKYFLEIAEHVLILGSQGYPELAQKLHQNKTQIIGSEKYGV